MGHTTAAEPTFSEWLREQFARMAELEMRPEWGARTLAKRIAPDNTEAARRTINRYLHDGARPTEEWAHKIAAGLGISRDEVPLVRQEASREGSPFRDGSGSPDGGGAGGGQGRGPGGVRPSRRGEVKDAA